MIPNTAASAPLTAVPKPLGSRVPVLLTTPVPSCRGKRYVGPFPIRRVNDRKIAALHMPLNAYRTQAQQLGGGAAAAPAAGLAMLAK